MYDEAKIRLTNNNNVPLGFGFAFSNVMDLEDAVADSKNAHQLLEKLNELYYKGLGYHFWKVDRDDSTKTRLKWEHPHHPYTEYLIVWKKQA